MRVGRATVAGVLLLFAGPSSGLSGPESGRAPSCEASVAGGPESARASEGSSADEGKRFLASDWLLGQRTVESRKPLYWDVWAPPLASGIALGIVELAVDPPKNARWVGRNGFDDGIRDALRAGSASGRNSASTASDALFAALGGMLVVDRALGRERHPFVKSLGSDATWFFSNSIFTQVVKVSAGRQRPFVTPCAADPDYSSACDSGRDRNASFFSGHASSAATLAGLLCSRHRDLLTWDGLWCGGSIGATVATGLLRITADSHWATDVIAGWGTGAIFGYVLPTYLWPAWDEADRPVSAESLTNLTAHLRAVSPVVSHENIGLQYEIRF